jgi:hypothetical protein
MACRERVQPLSSDGPSRTAASGPARVIRVEDDAVVIEGRWLPMDTDHASPSPVQAVRATCLKGPRTCQEELTVLQPEGGAPEAPQRRTLDYQIKQWTKWKIVAVHQGSGGSSELRISTIGLAAEKVSIDRGSRGGSEAHWRLE